MKLQVVMLNTHRTYIALVHENETKPYGKRLVTIKLTPDQISALVPRMVGELNGKPRYEEIGEVWLEEE